jgi:hypothetical protein
MAGTTLLAGTGGLLAGNAALAAGIGAGLATYAQTGGSGSKALLSGLTAGFGTNAINTGAAASAGATAGTNAATNAATQGLDFAGQTAASQTANAAAQAAYQPQTAFSAGKDMFRGGFDQGAKSLATGLMSPSGMVAGASLGTQGVMNSQELYEQQMRQFEEDEEQRRRDMYANNPEVQLYSAAGGLTQFRRGGSTDDDQYSYQSSRQVYAPAKTQYQVNPDFMAGFAPETMYFRPDTINAPSMSTLGGSRPTLGADTYTGTKGGYDYEGSVDADGNYTAGTAQGVQFAPQTSIDPYAAFTGSAPQGLVQSAYNPYPVQPMSMSPIEILKILLIILMLVVLVKAVETLAGGGGLYDGDQGYFSDINFMEGDMSGFDPSMLDYSNVANLGFNPTLDLGIDASISESMGGNNLGMSGNAEINPSAYLPFSQDFFQPQDVSYIPPALDNSFQPQDFSYIPQDVSYTPQNPSLIDNYSLINNLMDNSSLMDNSFTPDGPMGRAQGGVTNYANQGQTEIMPMDVMPEASAQPMQDPLIQEVTMFILGESDNEQAVNQFVDKYGVEAFSQLREQILQSLVPNAQTEGLIAGVGNGGMDDDIMGTIGNKEKIAVSQDEFIVPADVVSMLGDGSSDAGSKELYDMMDRVRQKKTGTTKQAPKLANAGGYLPA